MAVFRELDITPNDSSDEDINEDLERSGFEDDAVEVPPAVQSPARWSSQFTFLSLGDAGSSPVHHQQPHAPVNYLPHEILLHIFRHVSSSRDLYAALLVCRAWCQCSVELLWHKPQFNKLGSIFKMIHTLGKKDAIFQYATFIRRLNFTLLGSDFSDQHFIRLAACVRLERLTLFGCSAISDENLHRVLRCCPNLVALDLTGVVSVTDLSIRGLAHSSPRLQGINLGGCKQVTDVGIVALAEQCRNLRRIKLSGLESLTDAPVTALSRHCPLLLELDLHNCPLVTDKSVRDLWTHSSYLRELRLSNALNLTERAFPVPPPKPGSSAQSPIATTPIQPAQPPLVLPRPFDHLRMLDLTGCVNLTDDAMEGIVVNCPKVRNLVLAKCGLLTDEAIGSICKLGRHLHYLHLGHVSNITDRAVIRLARACSRLRYIDLACCPLLTDMSVIELAVLPKLRRIGLVRVPNLTDQAIYSLGEQQTSLERIHLSYCENISVQAINFLLQRLLKLTHLSLTGIPAFRRPELQKFCRPPPKEFTQNQRAAFCVYSGHGVIELRRYLQALISSLTENDRINGGGPPDSDGDDDDTDGADAGDDGEFIDLKDDATVLPTLPRINGNHTTRHRPRTQRHIPISTTMPMEPTPTTGQETFVWPPAARTPTPGEQQPGGWYLMSDRPFAMNGIAAASSTAPPLPYPLTSRLSQLEQHQYQHQHQYQYQPANASVAPTPPPVHPNGAVSPPTYTRRGQGLFSFASNSTSRAPRPMVGHRGPVPPHADSAPGTSSYILAGAGRGNITTDGSYTSSQANPSGQSPSPLSLQNVNANDGGGPSVRHWSQSQVNGTTSPAPSPSVSAAGFASNDRTLSPPTGTSFLSSWRTDRTAQSAAIDQALVANGQGGSHSHTSHNGTRMELRALEESLQSALAGTASATAAGRGRERQRGRDFPVMREMPSETPLSTSTTTTPVDPPWRLTPDSEDGAPSTSRYRPRG